MGTPGQVMHLLGRAARFTGQALDRFGSRLRGVAGAHCQEECVLVEFVAVMKHCTIMDVFGKTPVIAKSVFVALSSSVRGDVEIGEKSSIWYGCVLRGDVHHIKVGSETNIQDNTLVHVAKTTVSGNVAPIVIGSRVTIGHNVVLHALHCGGRSACGYGCHYFGWRCCRERCYGSSWISRHSKDPHTFWTDLGREPGKIFEKAYIRGANPHLSKCRSICGLSRDSCQEECEDV